MSDIQDGQPATPPTAPRPSSGTGTATGTASGTSDAGDATSLAAQTSATAAYGVAAGETPFTTLAGGTVGGLTLSPGVYTASSAMQLTGPLTLNAGGRGRSHHGEPAR